MNFSLSRRHFLTTVAAVGAITGSPPFNSRRAQAASTASTRLVVARRTIEVNGKSASVVGIRQPDGTAGLILDPGQQFNITVENQTAEPTIVHWHGQTPPFGKTALPIPDLRR
jgi:FtsP/CotA-like multicopper oxidase with cupredoxin domain